MAELRDDDLMLVNRAGVSYKATGAEIKDSLKPDEEAPDINAVALTEIENGYRYTDKEFPYTVDMAADGNPPPTYAVKAKLSGTTFNFAVESDAITKVEGGGTNVYTTDTIANVEDVNEVINYANSTSIPVLQYGKTANIFDGDLTTGAGRQSGMGVQMTNLPTARESVSFYISAARYQVQCMGQIKSNIVGAKWTTFNLSGLVNRVEINATESGAVIDLRAIKIDDVLLVDGVFNTGAILTFPTSNNFDKFEVGDVVQSTKTFNEFDWASLVEGPPANATYSPSKSFDNNTATFSFADLNSYLKFVPTQFGSAKSVKITYKIGSTGGAADASYLRVNGVDVNDVFANNTLIEKTIDVTGVGLNSIEWYATSSSLYCGVQKIEVDGRTLVQPGTAGGTGEDYSITAIDADGPTITVDGGDWYVPPGNNYTEGVSATAPYSDNLGPEKIFDGSTNTGCTLNDAGVANRITIVFDPGIPYSNKIETSRIHGPSSTGNVKCAVNGQTDDLATLVPYNANGSVKTQVASGLGTLTRLEYFNSGPSNPAVCSIWVDEVLLVDSIGDTELTKTVAYETKLTVASDKDLSLITGDIYMTDGTVKQDGSGEFEPASYTPQTSEIASVSGEIYSNSLTANVSWGNPPTSAFDGNIETYASIPPGGQITFTYNLGTTAGDSIFFRFNKDNDNANREVSFNGGSNWLKEPTRGGGVTYVATGNITSVISRGSSPTFGSITINGVELIDTPTTLTFTTPNPDLQYFEVGDVVQTIKPDTFGSGAWLMNVRNPPNNSEGTLSFSPAPTPSDGKIWVYFDQNNSLNTEWTVTGSAGTQTFNNTGWIRENGTPSGAAGIAKGWHYYPYLGQVQSINCFENASNRSAWRSKAISFGSNNRNDALQGISITPLPSTQVQEPITFTVQTVQGIEVQMYCREFSTNVNFSPIYMFNMEADGTADVEYVEIIAIDTTANTMTVDGGEWHDSRDQIWSTEGSWTGDVVDKEAMFNGLAGDPAVTGTQAYINNSEFVYTFNPPITSIQTLEIELYTFGSTSGKSNHFYQYNSGGWITTTPNNELSNLFVTHSHSVSTLTNIGYKVSAVGNGGIARIWVTYTNGDRKLLVDNFGESSVTGGPYTAEGTFLEANGTEVNLSASSGRWIADNKAGIPFSFVPATPIVDTRNEAYGKLQIVNDKAMVTGIQADDPGFTNVTRKDYGITFPAAFATGNSPDDDLPMGTSISTIVQAKNMMGESIKESNVLLPSLPNPEGSAGPITGATETDLTVGTSANLDGFVANDALVMVDETGAVASYTPVTSTIASVDSSTVNATATAVPGFALQNTPDTFIDGNKTSYYNAAGVRVNFSSPVSGVFSFTSGGGATPTNTMSLYDSSDNLLDSFGGATTSDYANGITLTALSAISNVSYVVTSTSATGVSSDGCTWHYMELNGQMVVSTFTPGTTLTFNTPNPDLQYFEVGDVVQDGGWNQSKEWSNLFSSPAAFTQAKTNAFDGDTSSAADTTQGWTLDTSSHSFGAGTHSIKVLSGGATSITVNSTSLTDPGGSGVKTWTGTVNGEINTIFSNVGSASCRGIYIDDKLLVDQSVSNPNAVSITAIDTSANTMTVDGGSWAGADGSGDVDGETVATGPEKSGVATFVSTNGTDTMTVENSNLEFITNDNRLGEEFFIKKIFTALNANDPAHVEMQKAVNEAFEAFPKNVQARKTQIAKTFTKLVAGAAITKAELNALRVVVEAAAEDD
jgi:hypothetical protein